MTKPAGRVQRMLAFAAMAGLIVLVVVSLGNALPTLGLLDFGSFVASGRAAGQGLDPYGIYPLTFHVVMPGFESWNPNLNPPVALPLFELFDRRDPHESFRIWWSLSLVTYAAAVALLARRYAGANWLIPSLWAFSLAGFWDTLVLGQIYLPLVLLAVVGWLLLDRGRPILAGIAIGLVVAVKPNFLVWPGLLFLAGHVRAPIAAGVAAGAVSLVPVFFYGPDVYLQWAHLVATDANRAIFLTNASLTGILQRAGIGGVATVVNIAILAGLALWAFRRRPSPMTASALGLVGALIASPIAWVHYTLFLLPIFFAGRPNPPLVAAAILLLVPVPLVLTQLSASPLVQASVGSVYGWAVVLCLVGAATAARARRLDVVAVKPPAPPAFRSTAS